MKVQTTRFGELDIDDSKVINMPDSVVGFTEKRFIIMTPDNGGPFCWLQAVDNADLAFVVVDPKNCVADYSIKLTNDEYEKLDLRPESETLFLTLVTMAANPLDITVNLQGPIVLNPENMVAKQIVLEGGKYSTRHPFFGASERAVIASAKRTKEGAPSVSKVAATVRKKS